MKTNVLTAIVRHLTRWAWQNEIDKAERERDELQKERDELATRLSNILDTRNTPYPLIAPELISEMLQDVLPSMTDAQYEECYWRIMGHMTLGTKQ